MNEDDDSACIILLSQSRFQLLPIWCDFMSFNVTGSSTASPSPFLQDIDETELENSYWSAEEVLAELLKALFYYLPRFPTH